MSALQMHSSPVPSTPRSHHLPLQPLVISAPFGNYVQPRGATATLGTFTALRRPGRFWRILRTVRYYPRLGAWVNKIGLRNPGIEWVHGRVREGRIDPSDKMLSIHGFTDDDWWLLLDRAASIAPLAIELNLSCPNVGHVNWPRDLFKRAVATGAPIVAKLPPVNYEGLANEALDAGVRIFHCCNTIPVPAGGVSGKPLKPVSLQCIAGLRRIARERALEHDLLIIGGGGITTPQDIEDYFNAGAHRVAVGTKVMNPLYLFSHKGLDPLIQAAIQRCEARRS